MLKWNKELVGGVGARNMCLAIPIQPKLGNVHNTSGETGAGGFSYHGEISNIYDQDISKNSF